MSCLLICGQTFSSSLGSKAILSAENEAATPDSVIQAFDKTQRAREIGIAGYSATERYAVRRNGSQQIGAELIAHSNYSRTRGKDFQIVSRTGSGFLQSQVLDRVLDHEKELYAPGTRSKSLVTTDNYDMELLPQRDTENGQNWYVIRLTPKTKGPNLLNGEAYVDPNTFTLVRLKGIPSASTGLVSGRPDVERDFQLIDGYAMTTHADLKSKTFLAGETEISVDYSDYKVLHRN
jgi:hypothetical protein